MSHGLVNVLLVLGHESRIDLDHGWSQSRRFDKLQVGVSREHAGEPDKRLLKVVVGFGRNVVVLEILLSVESDLTRFDLAFLDINLVATKNNRDVLTDSHQITMPVGNVLVGDTAGDIKHDDSTLTLDVVHITEPSKLFLASSVPDIENNWTAVSVEQKGTNFNTNSG